VVEPVDGAGGVVGAGAADPVGAGCAPLPDALAVAAMTDVGPETAVLSPAVFDPVATIRSVWPRSASRTMY
jgi:hypothetical protein